MRNITTQTIASKVASSTCTVNAGNTSDTNLLIEIHKIIYLYQEKEITKKVYKNIMNSIKL